MSLRARAVAYLAVLHLMFGGLAVYLFRQDRLWLLAVEAVFLLSFVAGMSLVRELYRQIGLATEGLRLIRDEEFTSRLRPVGQPEVDRLVEVYNRMADHLRAERVRVAEQHQFLSQVLQVSPSGVVVLDFDGRVSSVNPAAERLLGRPSAAVVGRRLDELGTPLGDALVSLPAGEARLVGLLGARRVRCHHGTFVDRGFSRSFVLIEELTEELRQFERAAYEKLIRVMSHEVNNTVAASNSLLHSSLAYARELQAASREDLEHALGIVIERTAQLGAFMRRFADVFRLPPPQKDRCDLIPVLTGISRLLAATPAAEGVTWCWSLPQPSLLVDIDRGQMEQALMNIVKNALEAAGGGGTVTIGVAFDEGAPVLTVEDTGPGFAAEAQSNLFTPFFSTKPHGQGIGLTLVQEILAGHGFGYSLERTPQQTTRFTIRFGGGGGKGRGAGGSGGRL